MRITAVETVPYSLPFRDEYVTARGAPGRAARWCCFGCAPTRASRGSARRCRMTLRGGDSLERVDRALRRSHRRIRRLDPSGLAGEEPLEAAIDAFIHVAAGRRLAGPAAAALEMAIFDLAGKLSGQPVWRLLRAERAEPVPCNATLAAGDPGAVAEAALRWRERGFDTFKLKLGAGRDVEQVRAVRDAVGPAARIRVDANAAFGADRGGRAAARARAAGHRARRAALSRPARPGGSGRRRARSRSPPTRASPAPRTPTGPATRTRATSRPPSSPRPAASARRARSPPACPRPLQRPRRPGWDRGGGARRPGDLPDRRGSRAGPRPGDPGAVLRDRRNPGVQGSRRPVARSRGRRPGRRAGRDGARAPATVGAGPRGSAR